MKTVLGLMHHSHNHTVPKGYFIKKVLLLKILVWAHTLVAENTSKVHRCACGVWAGVAWVPAAPAPSCHVPSSTPCSWFLLYIFINKSIVEGGAQKAPRDFQLWLLNFSPVLLGPVSTLFLISWAANRILLSLCFSMHFCTGLCSCLVSVFFYLYNCFFGWIQYVCFSKWQQNWYFWCTYILLYQSLDEDIDTVVGGFLSKTRLVLLFFLCTIFHCSHWTGKTEIS